MRLPPVINVLSETIANQIAAGEVVERPAAVVKELGENAIDAGATRLVVRIEDGGRRLVEIEDDGHGLRKEDLRTALTRHATSKLAEAEDLFRVATLGFRGEALPSIAAVSEFTIQSRPHDQESGWCLRLDGGRELGTEPCAMGHGTVVTVRNLFWNVPARLKFLKAEQAETGHVTDQVIRLALAHPEVGMRLECDGRVVFDQPPGETLVARVRALFGKTFAESLIAVAESRGEGDTGGMELTGFVAHPREAKPTSKRQYVFLNGRFLRDKLLIAAVREGFKGHLEPRLHGAVFLHLQIDPSTVDVNVHPTKSEVRFRRESEVFAFTAKSIQQALAGHAGGFQLLNEADQAKALSAQRAESQRPGFQRTVIKPAGPPQLHQPPAVVVQERFLPPVEARVEMTPGSAVPSPGSVAPPPGSAGASPAQTPTAEHQRFAEATAPNRVAEPVTAYSATSLPSSFAAAPSTPPAGEAPANPGAGEAPALPGPATSPANPGISGNATLVAGEAPALPGPATSPVPATLPGPRNPEPGTAKPDPLRSVRRIIQLNRMYLLIETDTGIRLVDQHALHEKALWLCLDPSRTDLTLEGRQELLIPKPVELTAAEVAAVAPLLTELATFGIEAEVFGPTTVLVRSHPARLRRLDWPRFFVDLAADGAGKAVGNLRERISHRAACHAAVKAGQELNPEECRELVRLLYELEGTDHCPHGRPTTLDLTWGELARRFQR